MEEVFVRIWDDRVRHDTGERVEAAEKLVVEHRGKRYRLDLTTENAARLDADLDPWLTAAQRLRDDGDTPVLLHGFKPGSAKARAWRAGLRAWAQEAGRSGEVHERRAPSGKVNYTYDYGLEQDYQDHLLEKAAQFVRAQVA